MNLEDAEFFACDYCGGYAGNTPKGQDPTIHRVTFMSLNWFGVSREICAKCYIKVFDTVLGEPKK